MALDVRPVCEGEECYVEMVQNVDMVIDVERSIRRNSITPALRMMLMYIVDSPIPRPEPLDQLRCDQSKPYASDDVCFPVESVSNSAFSIEEIFGRSIRGACPVAQSSDTGNVHVQLFPSMKVEPRPDSISDNKFHYTLTGTDPPPFHLMTQTNPSICMQPS
jgi:phosphatidylinositol glycan class T